MKIKLIYRKPLLGRAWRKFFADSDKVEVLEGDICRAECNAVVSPANSFGFMDGGLDRALSDRFGWQLQERLQKIIAKRPLGELLVGQALIVDTGNRSIPWLICAPTMRVPMKLRQSINAYLAMKAILVAVSSHSQVPAIETVAIPGLGTGVGALTPETSARQMWTAYREMALGKKTYPENFAEAQKNHLALNPDDINLYD